MLNHPVQFSESKGIEGQLLVLGSTVTALYLLYFNRCHGHSYLPVHTFSIDTPLS